MKKFNIIKFTLLAFAIAISAQFASTVFTHAIDQSLDYTANAGAIGTTLLVAFAGLIVLKTTGFSQQGALFTAFDITELTTALGAYIRKDKGGLISKMLLGMDIDDRMEVWDDCKDQVPMPSLGITDLVKPANNTTFAPTSNALAIGARILQVRAWKVDLQLVPADLVKSWLGAYKKKGSNAFDIPFEQYIMNHIIAKIHENIRMKALFAGTYNSAGTTPGAIMDGLKKLIADEITATTITPVTTGAVTSSNIITSLEAVYDAIGEAYKNTETQALVSPTLFDWYTRKYRTDFGGNMDYNGMAIGSLRLDGTSCIVKREPGLTGSQRIIVTPKSNIVYGVDSLADTNNMEVQKFDRTIKILIDGKSGVQFKEIHSDALAVNNVA